MISDHVEFESDHFAVVPHEDEETNPGIYGLALAEWVAAQLRARGVSIEAVIAEDFGRCVMVKRRPFVLLIACANASDSKTRWQMFIALERNILSRLFGRADPQPDLARLRDHFRTIVAEVPGVSNIAWNP